MAKTLNDILSEFSKIEENWNFILDTSQYINFPEGNILDLKIYFYRRKRISMRDAHFQIIEAIELLRELSTLEQKIRVLVEKRDVDFLNPLVEKIAKATKEMQTIMIEMRATQKYRLKSSNLANKTIVYTNNAGIKNEFRARDCLYPIASATIEIITEYQKQIELIKSGAVPVKVAMQNKKSNSKKIKNIEEESKEHLKAILEARQVSEEAIRSMLDKGQNALDEMEYKRARMVTLDVGKALYYKRNASFAALVVATIFYFVVLGGFVIYLRDYLPDISSTLKASLELEGTFQLVTARILLVSPYALLIIFASQYYNRAFRRSEYYASKYIIASLIEAFKEQMEYPEYKDAIASTVFSELLLDPADYVNKMEKRKKEKESVITSLINKIKGKVTEGIDMKAELQKLIDEIEKSTGKKATPPPTE